MTRPSSAGPSARLFRRAVVPVLVLLVVAVTVGCSDAHTAEEKAWADTGISPDILTVFVDPTFIYATDMLVSEYEKVNLDARVVTVDREEEQIAEAVADSDAPSVWIAPASTFEGLEADDRTVQLGATPLVIAYPRDGRPAPSIDIFATEGNGTGMCTIEETCGINGRQLLANLGLEPTPDLVADADSMVLQLRAKTLEAALIFGVDASSLWLRVVNDNVATDDPALAEPWVARPFGDEGSQDDLLDWLATAEEARSALVRGGLSLPPAEPEEVGS